MVTRLLHSTSAHLPLSLQSVVVAGDGVRDEVGVAVRVDDAHGRDARLATVDYGEVVVVLLALKWRGDRELAEETKIMRPNTIRRGN